MKKVKSIKALNTLLEINNEMIEGYETASTETGEADLKNLFSELKQTSQNLKEELTGKVENLGGMPFDGTSTTSKLYKVWMDVKTALSFKDRKAILNTCEHYEQLAVETYEKVLKNNRADMSEEHQAMISHQLSLIKADQDKLAVILENLALKNSQLKN